ncbi:MAG: hypothetical protein JNL83_37065 [Myxococcales bacterium]|nr:hypothetical protein [Myxococcales bacterium]
MRSVDALSELQRLIEARGATLETLAVHDGLALMIEHYRTTRAEDCSLDEDGDMLLFQWGTYDWGKGPFFEIDLTRQFATGGGDDEDIWQLSLTFLFWPTRSLPAGHRWCARPSELDDFARFVWSHPALATADEPVRVELDYTPAG